MTDLILVRCASYRARDRLFAKLCRSPVGYYHFGHPTCYGYYRVMPDELSKAQQAKGVMKFMGKTTSWLPTRGPMPT